MSKKIYIVMIMILLLSIHTGCVESEKDDGTVNQENNATEEQNRSLNNLEPNQDDCDEGVINNNQEYTYEKPVIYLYPEEEITVNVELIVEGKILCTYPDYSNGWEFKVDHTGKIIDMDQGNEYNYLFWEANIEHQWVIDKGFLVEGKDTVTFLEDKLSYLGLNQQESNDFIVYWLPKMIDNKYNLIYFAGNEYQELAKLNISPKPDSILRVFMVWESLDESIIIENQELEPFIREGFSVVEWGGLEVEGE